MFRSYQIQIPNLGEETLTASDFESDTEEMYEPLLPTLENIPRWVHSTLHNYGCVNSWLQILNLFC